MTDKLPPNLLALFAPRPPLRWVPPSDHAPEERKTANISGVASFLPKLQEYKETDEYVPTESWLQRKDRIKLEKQQNRERLLKEGPQTCKDVPMCFGYLLSSLVQLPGIEFRNFQVSYADVLMILRQTARRSEYSWRCFQDAHCCTPELRCHRARS